MCSTRRLVCASWVCASITSNWLTRNLSAAPELVILIGLHNLTTNGRPMVPPKLNRRRAATVLSKIDEILAWEKNSAQERDIRFVDLGRYLCEVRAGQYWRLDNLRSFDEFLERKFPESRRKAYYLMAIHEHLPRIPKSRSSIDGLDQGQGIGQGGASGSNREFDCAPWVHEGTARATPGTVQAGSGKAPDREGNRSSGRSFISRLYKSQLPVIERALETAVTDAGCGQIPGLSAWK